MPATYEPIATTTITGSSTTTISFTSIGSGYTDLRLILTGAFGSSTDNVRLQINSDTASNYSWTELRGDGASATSLRGTSATSLFCGGGLNYSTSNYIATYHIDLFSYAGSTNKTVLNTVSADTNGSGRVSRFVGLWRSTSAITSLQIFGQSSTTWQAGTTATLYGILKA